MSALATPPEVHVVHQRLGFRSANCERCVPAHWHDDARAGQLRPAVVGGVPISTPNQGPGAEPSGLPAIQRADALAGCASDGGSPETERAIAQATPGPTTAIHSTPRSGPVALSPLGAGSDQAAEGRAQPVAG